MKQIILSKYLEWSNQGILEVIRRKGVPDADIHCFYKAHFYDFTCPWPEYKSEYKEVTPEQFAHSINKYLQHYLVVGEGFPNEDKDNTFFSYNCVDKWREDPDAISVVEEFGGDFCGERHYALKVEEFDDTVYDYKIVYDDKVGEVLELYPKIKWNKEALS